MLLLLALLSFCTDIRLCSLLLSSPHGLYLLLVDVAILLFDERTLLKPLHSTTTTTTNIIIVVLRLLANILLSAGGCYQRNDAVVMNYCIVS